MPAFPLSSESFVKDLPCVLPPIISPLSCVMPPIASHLSYFPPFSRLSVSHAYADTHILRGFFVKWFVCQRRIQDATFLARGPSWCLCCGCLPCYHSSHLGDCCQSASLAGITGDWTQLICWAPFLWCFYAQERRGGSLRLITGRINWFYEIKTTSASWPKALYSILNVKRRGLHVQYNEGKSLGSRHIFVQFERYRIPFRQMCRSTMPMGLHPAVFAIDMTIL